MRNNLRFQNRATNSNSDICDEKEKLSTASPGLKKENGRLRGTTTGIGGCGWGPVCVHLSENQQGRFLSTVLWFPLSGHSTSAPNIIGSAVPIDPELYPLFV